MENENRNRRFSEDQSHRYGNVNDNRGYSQHNEEPYRERQGYGQQSQGYRHEDERRQGTSYGSGQQSYGSQEQQYGRHQGGQNYGTSDYGSQDHLSDNYGSNYGRQDYGGSNFGSSYGQDYNQRTSYGSGYGDNYGRRDNDWNERRHVSSQQHSGAGMHDENRHSYRDEYGRYRDSEQRVNMNREEPRNRYGGDTSNYGNANQGGFDRNWWDRAKDEVSSWFGDDDADRRRRGYDGPHKGKGPKGYKRSDERIREDVCDRLCDNPMIDASNIDIKVEGSEVILTGTVESREDKRRAEDIAESISGVSNVQNQIRVSPRDNIGSGSRYDSHERKRD